MVKFEVRRESQAVDSGKLKLQRKLESTKHSSQLGLEEVRSCEEPF